jgi:uncharacterized protein YbaR (Trm112 family)
MDPHETAEEPGHPTMDEKLLAILVCPACHTSLEKLDAKLLCRDCGRRYPIRDGIPVMLLEEAELPESDADGPVDGAAAPQQENP